MFKERFYQTRKACWKIIAEKYPEQRDKYGLVQDLISATLTDGAVVLDAGCGHNSIIPEVKGITCHIVGIDMVHEDVKRNTALILGAVANIDHIPLTDESVDMVVCNMVFEHLKNPSMVFKEIARVLKPGGSLIFMTPSVYNIVTIINRLIPNALHQQIGHLITGVDESDIFPTFYRANSPSRLRELLGAEGLVEKDLVMYQPPPYAFVFSRLICRLVIRYYQYINSSPRWASLRGVIIARFQKA